LKTFILDSSVALKWWRDEAEAGQEEALLIEELYTSGSIRIAVPSLFFAEVLNVVNRRWKWPDPNVHGLGEVLAELNFEVRDPSTASVALWCTRGLSGYDATYAALAFESNFTLVTADARLANIGAAHVLLSEVDVDGLLEI
jgi:predicted nucleic acid-binding protein